MSGMDELGKAIADGRADFHDSLNMLTNAHLRLFGMPGDVVALQRRITLQLAIATPRTAFMAHAVDADMLPYEVAVGIVVDHTMENVRITADDRKHAIQTTHWVEQTKHVPAHWVFGYDPEHELDTYRQSIEDAVSNRLVIMVERLERDRNTGLER